MNKFEKLIEYVINEEEAKAAELFHEIVVEKSRDIYESLMNSDRELGGDEADQLINDIEADENGMNEEDDEFGDEEGFDHSEPDADDMGGIPDGDADDMGMGDEMGIEGGEADLEDRVVDLEDQLDSLMAEFDSIMGGEEDMGMEPDMGDEMGMEPGFGDEKPEMEGRFNEAVSLTKVTNGISNSTEEGTVNKRTVNADNSGAKGAAAKPHQNTGEESGASTPSYKPGDSTTEPNKRKVTEPKKTGEDAGTNTRSLSGSK
jgi:hypothetical protein